MKDFADESEQSDFNAAIATLMRIDEIKKLLIIGSLSHNYEQKFVALEAYFLELVSMMNKDDDALQKTKYFEIRNEYNQYLRDRTIGKTPKLGLWESLIQWEMELRNAEQKYGMNMPRKADPRWAMASSGRRR